MPSPPALFSPLTTTKSGRSVSRRPGNNPRTTSRPVEPTTSPTKRILTRRRVARMTIPEFLEALLTATGPSGYETPAAQVWRESARSFTDDVSNDTIGSAVARVPASADDGPLIGVVRHHDAIGPG